MLLRTILSESNPYLSAIRFKALARSGARHNSDTDRARAGCSGRRGYVSSGEDMLSDQSFRGRSPGSRDSQSR